ncbi:GNAT family N-acetyltransferase [Blastococcus aggregatus]|nr:GNAT family N-acetyltransferase [Blastococcus aggregatus]
MTPLGANHDISSFDCGAPELTRWLGQAHTAQERDTARVFVVADEHHRVLAYSALVVGSTSPRSLPSRARGGLSADIPMVLLGRLAVDQAHQRSGLGDLMLIDAVRRAIEVRERAGTRLLAAHPRDELARRWYEHKGLASTTDGRLCYLRLRDAAPPREPDTR